MDNSALFFQLFKQLEDRLFTEKNNGAYKIIIEKNKEKFLLNKANLENNEFKEYINCDSDNDDKLKKIFNKKISELFTFKIKKKLIKKRRSQRKRII